MSEFSISKRAVQSSAGFALFLAAACTGGQTVTHGDPRPTVTRETPSPTPVVCNTYPSILLFPGQGEPLADAYGNPAKFYVQNIGQTARQAGSNTILLKHDVSGVDTPNYADASQPGFFSYPDGQTAIVQVNGTNNQAIVEVEICGSVLPHPTATA